MSRQARVAGKELTGMDRIHRIKDLKPSILIPTILSIPVNSIFRDRAAAAEVEPAVALFRLGFEQLFDGGEGGACGLDAGVDELGGAREFVPAQVPDRGADADVGELPLVLDGDALHDEHRLQEDAD